jgi:hypothetical protein
MSWIKDHSVIYRDNIDVYTDDHLIDNEFFKALDWLFERGCKINSNIYKDIFTHVWQFIDNKYSIFKYLNWLFRHGCELDNTIYNDIIILYFSNIRPITFKHLNWIYKHNCKPRIRCFNKINKFSY